MKTKKLAWSIVLLNLVTFTVNAQQAVNDISFGKGLMNYVAADSSFSVKFAPRMQVRYYGSMISFGGLPRNPRSQQGSSLA